jgi:hypothetical protein
MSGTPQDYIDRASAVLESDVEGNRRAVAYLEKAIELLEGDE